MATKRIGDSEGTGAGPWEFENDSALSPGESMFLDFPNMEYQKTKRFFGKHLPFDVVQVTNLDVDNALSVEYNNRYTDTVVPNAVETFSDQGVTTVRITNAGSTSIGAGDVKVAVKVEPYGADQEAREEHTEPWAKRALNDIIPGGLP